MKMAIAKSEEREKQQDSCDHIMGLCGKTLYQAVVGGGLLVSTWRNQQLGLWAFPSFEERGRPARKVPAWWELQYIDLHLTPTTAQWVEICTCFTEKESGVLSIMVKVIYLEVVGCEQRSKRNWFICHAVFRLICSIIWTERGSVD